ncbi:MAG: 3-deoxy-7-phosphoheptulonate synthase [Candidatus Dadabacteria bacterium]|nr:MAG: 3-deoxy-7-phosphoheptulonate synthase [Candidatus Dadabacteria bacterium]
MESKKLNQEQLDDEKPGPDKVAAIRDEINNIDSKIIELLARRRECSARIIKVKDVGRVPVRDREREEKLLIERIQFGKEKGLDAYFTTKIFHEIIDDSIRVQHEYLQSKTTDPDRKKRQIRVVFQGVEGAYSHLAAQRHFEKHLQRPAFYLGCPTFAEVMQAVEKGQADYAVLPIENTMSGGINEVYDLLMHTQLSITGEVKFKINHCLLGLEGADIANIKKIYCHPQTVQQCSKFISSLSASVEYFSDSAMSVKRLKDLRDPTIAAIASKEAARLFGLDVLKEHISDQEENYTRFLIAARKARDVDLRIPAKTSIVISTSQEPGSLVKALQVFHAHSINLTKLESRPIVGNPWEEMFYIDFLGNIAEERVAQALDELTRSCRFIKILGSYPISEEERTRVSPLNANGSNGRQPKTLPVVEEKSPAERIEEVKKRPKISRSYKLASREYKPEDTVLNIRGVKLGNGNFAVIAGPCSVESFDQVMACAKHARENGAHILRGGCFKPRTSPYSFQGLGWEGLDMLAEAGKTYDMPIITEVLRPEDVNRVAEKADILQVGARNMQNFPLLSEVGKAHRPVMLKRGMSSSIEELLNAAEYILAQGNQQVFLCERGIRTFETATRTTLDLSAVPVLKERTHLPVVVDPSHAAGQRDLVIPLALAAKSVGAHAIMVEFHPEPEKALSDGPQALYFSQFEDLMRQLYL